MNHSTFTHPAPQLAYLDHTGPTNVEDYLLLQQFYSDIAEKRKNGHISAEEVAHMRQHIFGGSFQTPESIQGHVGLCARGYYGDFEIIDKMYTRYEAPSLPHRNWDRFMQAGDMPQAVRNRKAYFIEKLASLPEGARVLNLASGPCRDLLEFDQQYQKHLQIDCIDLDADAIAYAQYLLQGATKLDVSFTQANIYRFESEKQYDLVWSAGLFDYFDDKAFVEVLDRLTHNVKPGGRMIIGNFRRDDEAVAYMEFAGWFLQYRDAKHLCQLTDHISFEQRQVEQEPLGLNLFLNLYF